MLHYCFSKSPSLYPILSQQNLVSVPAPCVCNTHFNIILRAGNPFKPEVLCNMHHAATTPFESPVSVSTYSQTHSSSEGLLLHQTSERVIPWLQETEKTVVIKLRFVADCWNGFLRRWSPDVCGEFIFRFL